MSKTTLRRVVLILLVLTFGCGCDGLFVRDSPPRSIYIDEFFPMLAGADFELDFHYVGGVGGYGTIAKIKGNELLIRQITEAKSQGGEVIKFNDGITMEKLKFRIEELFEKGKIPKWASLKRTDKYHLIKVNMKGKTIEVFTKDDFSEAFFIEIGE